MSKFELIMNFPKHPKIQRTKRSFFELFKNFVRKKLNIIQVCIIFDYIMPKNSLE